MSTATRPKQLIPVLDGRSLLDEAVARARTVVDADRVWFGVGTTVADALPADVDRTRVVVEPHGRDTMPAIGLGMAAIAASDPDAVVAVLTADHVIEPMDDFAAALAAGVSPAEQPGEAPLTLWVGARPPPARVGLLQLRGGNYR